MLRIIALSFLVGCVPPGGGGSDDSTTRPRANDGGTRDVSVAMCTPDCGARSCGDDGCGGNCGLCEGTLLCALDGQCVAPSADCGNGMCGEGEDCATCPDDCGQCCGNGTCDVGEHCGNCPDCECAVALRCDPVARMCVEACQAECGARVCGSDGCGGFCGVCEGEQQCLAGACVAPEEGAPVIEALTADRERLTEGETVRLSATVSDPDGVSEGVVADAEGLILARFAMQGEAWAAQLSWAELNAEVAVEFEAGGSAERLLVITFFDAAGSRATRELVLTLHCGELGACAGRCAGLDSADNCGVCGQSCGPDEACVEGACGCAEGSEACAGACVDTRTDQLNCGGCGQACAANEACVASRCECAENCAEVPPVYITELMIDPTAVRDTAGEWFEVYNPADVPARLDGWRFGDPIDIATGEGNDFYVIEGLSIQPRTYFVFGRNADRAENGGVNVNQAYNRMTLAQDGDSLALVDADGNIIDRVDYTMDWPITPGESTALGAQHGADNMSVDRWCLGPEGGTPGRANPNCP